MKLFVWSCWAVANIRGKDTCGGCGCFLREGVGKAYIVLTRAVEVMTLFFHEYFQHNQSLVTCDVAASPLGLGANACRQYVCVWYVGSLIHESFPVNVAHDGV